MLWETTSLGLQDIDMSTVCVVSVKRQILQYQSCPLGLFPTIGSKDNQSRAANVRDSIYCAVAAWSLSQAYRLGETTYCYCCFQFQEIVRRSIFINTVYADLTMDHMDLQ